MVARLVQCGMDKVLILLWALLPLEGVVMGTRSGDVDQAYTASLLKILAGT